MVRVIKVSKSDLSQETLLFCLVDLEQFHYLNLVQNLLGTHQEEGGSIFLLSLEEIVIEVSKQIWKRRTLPDVD